MKLKITTTMLLAVFSTQIVAENADLVPSSFEAVKNCIKNINGSGSSELTVENYPALCQEQLQELQIHAGDSYYQLKQLIDKWVANLEK